MPPSDKNKLELSVEETVSGDGKVLVVCELKPKSGGNIRPGDLGTPPVNITIYVGTVAYSLKY